MSQHKHKPQLPTQVLLLHRLHARTRFCKPNHASYAPSAQINRFYLQKSVLIISIVNMIDWKPIYQPLVVW
ncbi:hypothetical protein AB3S75_019327 [Citrus x aurantiifolia]